MRFCARPWRGHDAQCPARPNCSAGAVRPLYALYPAQPFPPYGGDSAGAAVCIAFWRVDLPPQVGKVVGRRCRVRRLCVQDRAAGLVHGVAQRWICCRASSRLPPFLAWCGPRSCWCCRASACLDLEYRSLGAAMPDPGAVSWRACWAPPSMSVIRGCGRRRSRRRSTKSWAIMASASTAVYRRRRTGSISGDDLLHARFVFGPPVVDARGDGLPAEIDEGRLREVDNASSAIPAGGGASGSCSRAATGSFPPKTPRVRHRWPCSPGVSRHRRSVFRRPHRAGGRSAVAQCVGHLSAVSVPEYAPALLVTNLWPATAGPCSWARLQFNRANALMPGRDGVAGRDAVPGIVRPWRAAAICNWRRYRPDMPAIWRCRRSC